MLYVSGSSAEEGTLAITDTSDGVTEQWRLDDVVNIVRSKKAKILGVSADGSCHNATLDVINQQLARQKLAGVLTDDMYRLRVIEEKKCYDLILTVAFKLYKREKFIVPFGVTGVDSDLELSGAENLMELYLPDTVISVGGFRGCKRLKNVRLSQNLQKIESYCFYMCSSLEQLDLPSTLNVLGAYSLASNGLKDIALPDGVWSVGDHAFYLENVNRFRIPKFLRYVGANAFDNMCAKEMEWFVRARVGNNFQLPLAKTGTAKLVLRGVPRSSYIKDRSYKYYEVHGTVTIVGKYLTTWVEMENERLRVLHIVAGTENSEDRTISVRGSGFKGVFDDGFLELYIDKLKY